MPRRLLLAALLGGLIASATAPAAAGVTLTRFPAPDVTFDSPVNLAAAPGDEHRVYVVERAGRVRLVKDGVLLAQPFLDLSAEVDAAPTDQANGFFSENGLASIAFAPDYATSGKLYAFFTDAGRCDTNHRCDDRLVELHRSDADPDVAGTAERTLLVVPHRFSAVHHAGQLAFGPDGRLWVTTGDGGASASAQDPSSLSGKVLRLDPAEADPQPEVLAMGLRNPYRFSFAPTGDLVVGDVGEFVREEIDILPAGTTGENFGWAVCEGAVLRRSSDPCPPDPVPNYVAPVYEYPHGAGCWAVTGGLVVRDAALGDLRDRYLFGDYCQAFVRSARLGASALSDVVDLPVGVQWLTAFGQDARCAVYIVANDGPVYRLDPSGGSPAHSCDPPSVAAPEPFATPASAPAITSAPATGDAVAPRLTAVRLSRIRFVVGRTRHRPPRGTTFRFWLSERATLTLRVFRVAARPPRRARLAGTLSRRFGPGHGALPFSGRIGGRALGPGRYRVSLRARDSAGNLSVARELSFTIVGR